MSIQDILDELHISKGAFYHYFDSKQALLDGLIDRIWDEVHVIFKPILQDPNKPAIEKLLAYFKTSIQWKTAKRDFVIGLLRVWYADENAIVRQKQQAAMLKRISPLIVDIINQGVREGSISTAYPSQTGDIVLILLVNLGDAWAGLLLSDLPGEEILSRVQALVKAHIDAMERVLGAEPGSLAFLDEPTIQEWSILSNRIAV